MWTQDKECLELHNFIKEAVAQTIAKEKISGNSERSKRQLPTTTPDRNEFKKPHSKERACNKSTTIKSLFAATTARESLVKIATDTQFNFLNLDITHEKQDNQTQLKVIIAYPNGDITAPETFDETTKSIIPQLKQYIIKALECGVSDEFRCLSKSETVLKGREVDEIIAFSNKPLIHEVSLLCPLWHACLKGMCGKKLSSRKSIKVNNSLARARNSKLSAFAYHVSAILFHSGTKHEDILHLCRLGICMSPDSTVHFQRKMGENHVENHVENITLKVCQL